MLQSDPSVRHIPAPDRQDWYGPDEHLRWLVRESVDQAVWPVAESALAELGELVPQRVEALAVAADRHPPVLHQYDARGERIDEIEFHPAYHELIDTVLGFGTVHSAHVPGWRGLRDVAPKALSSALSYMFLQADQAITGCPVGMMDAMARCLARNDPELSARFVPRIADDTGRHLTSAMFLTEKAGGSDVGANETVAVRGADGDWRLHGEKWFASCPQSDLVLVMARPEGAPPGPAGLGLFLMPHLLDDGSRNAILVHRLKNKFGTRAMASGEVGLDGAFAWQVGRLDRGMRQMMDMVSLTRVGIITATAGAMRRNALEALSHTARRATFGSVLQTHPLMRDSLAELVVDSTAALSAAVVAGELLERGDAGELEAAGALRLVTPLFKGYFTERARICGGDAMEIRGGNGFIEDWPDARMLRDVSVHAIWEGSGNVIALDVLRALGRGAGPHFLGDLERRAEATGGAAAPLAAPLLAEIHGLVGRLDQLADADAQGQQLPMRRLARRMAVLAAATLLAEQASRHAASTNSGRLVWIAARFAARLGGEPMVDSIAADTAWLAHADALLNGGHVAVEVGATAAATVANALSGRPGASDGTSR
ncbi:MAG: acyl-CoA dehydrogenase family protein [Candidatus Dormibacteraeota bacterium]|uniref:Acyl-CoA dehydrogenase family protein n=1 Tax=Candidatus Amunia macphersoniae TaxID=3127014 RepID=A0A934KCC7_9BACT|nr:acyl-CoA dehydrogenase family protein [Candidatus Dormibacteraeota bacterium]